MKIIDIVMHSINEIQLAREMAERLGDPDAYSLYLSYAKKYAHRRLRELLAKVCSIPAGKIRKSRGALFTFLVEQQLPVEPTYDGE